MDTTEGLHFHFHFRVLEKEMATHSSVLAWRIPGTGEPGGLPSTGSYRVGHDWSDLAAAAGRLWEKRVKLRIDKWNGEGNGYPVQYSFLENPMDRGAWWATVHGVTKSQTQLSELAYTSENFTKKNQFPVTNFSLLNFHKNLP